MRTKDEIQKEIKSLEKLSPVGAFTLKTARSIHLSIEELTNGYDDTAGEFSELSDSDQDLIMQTRRWKEGETDQRPSEGWGGLVK